MEGAFGMSEGILLIEAHRKDGEGRVCASAQGFVPRQTGEADACVERMNMKLSTARGRLVRLFCLAIDYLPTILRPPTVEREAETNILP